MNWHEMIGVSVRHEERPALNALANSEGWELVWGWRDGDGTTARTLVMIKPYTHAPEWAPPRTGMTEPTDWIDRIANQVEALQLGAIHTQPW